MFHLTFPLKIFYSKPAKLKFVVEILFFPPQILRESSYSVFDCRYMTIKYLSSYCSNMTFYLNCVNVIIRLWFIVLLSVDVLDVEDISYFIHRRH